MTANDKAKAAIAQAGTMRPATGMDTMLTLLAKDSMKRQFEMALPAHFRDNASRYIRSFMTQLRQVPELARCTQSSLLGAMLTGTALGLDPTPSLGEFYILPYGSEAQFQIGYKGLLALAYRAGVRKIWAHEVCANDDFEITWGLDEDMKHKPCLDNELGRGATTGYYAAAVLENGEKTFFYMTKAEITEHAKRFSKAYDRGPWKTDFDEMAKKTVAKQLCKWMPKSTEMAHALERDEAIVRSPGDKIIKDAEDVLEMEVDVVENTEQEAVPAPGPTSHVTAEEKPEPGLELRS